MRALLDTSVAIAGIPEEVAEGAVSVITIAELSFGIERAVDSRERHRRLTRLAAITQTLRPLPVDLTVAAAWGGLAAIAAERGRQPRARSMDLLIAATAQAHGLPLLTLDEDLLWLADLIDVRRPDG